MPNVAIGVGTMEFPFSDAEAYWRWVDLCEAGGIDSIWQTDRLVGPLPFLECMSVMAALAGRTRRIKFGVNVLSLAMRDAVLVARQCATIDYLSNGRLLPAFGIGTGWQAGPETPEQAAKVVAAIKAAASEEGRRIDDDHYGAGVPFRFGQADDPALGPLFEAYKKRTGRDPKDYFAIGDAAAIV